MYPDATALEIEQVMNNAAQAFKEYRKKSLKEKADFMRAIAIEIEACGDELINTTIGETNLPEARLKGERGRTMFQLNSYADACENGTWLGVSINLAVPEATPPKPDLRKMLVPIGPVVVFGASNFAYAFSTAGGDTASALAAGCPVIVKAHPAHPKTSAIVANAVEKAIEKTNMPKHVFQHVNGKNFEIGKALVNNEHTAAVAFTGSYAGGKALFDLANQRKKPIPVFAEMGSTNPVFLLPEKLAANTIDIAKNLAASVTQGVGQFCTKPGLIIGLASQSLTTFIDTLSAEISNTNAGKMLHNGIANNYDKNKNIALSQPNITQLNQLKPADTSIEAQPVVAKVSAIDFLENNLLHVEVFGPYSLVVECVNEREMYDVASALEGQLTSTIFATENDVNGNEALVDAIGQLCGRFIMNGVPTGVEVCLSMQHGGPFPASTDSRFTSVGADSIKRFARPQSFQNWPQSLLPVELRDAISKS